MALWDEKVYRTSTQSFGHSDASRPPDRRTTRWGDQVLPPDRPRGAPGSDPLQVLHPTSRTSARPQAPDRRRTRSEIKKAIRFRRSRATGGYPQAKVREPIDVKAMAPSGRNKAWTGFHLGRTNGWSQRRITRRVGLRDLSRALRGQGSRQLPRRAIVLPGEAQPGRSGYKITGNRVRR